MPTSPFTRRWPISGIICLLICATTLPVAAQQAKRNEEYGDFNPGDKINTAGSEFVQVIDIKSPALRSEIKGDIKVEFQAPGMTQVKALCWQQPTREKPSPWGHDADLAPNLKLDAEGKGTFVFPADKFPNGPISIRILVRNEAKKQDVRELQLFNTGGIHWNQGVPKTDPPAAQGMRLLFADDFDGPLSISNNGKGKRYQAHKPGPKNEDFSGYPFTGPESPLNPFSQKDTYLRIHASKPEGTKGSAGIIAPVDSDGAGVLMKVPYYVESRFVAQSAPGTWPGFWTLTKGDWTQKGVPCDELDILEAYGGAGKGHPNAFGQYSATSHFWGQKGPDGKQFRLDPPAWKVIDMTKIGGGSSWSTTFHTYGLLVTKTDTIYYCDGIEVLHHPTQEVSRTLRHFFLINYAIGGISGWKIDLARDGNATDMWVDYVRVYQGATSP